MSGFKCTFRLAGDETFLHSLLVDQNDFPRGKGMFCWLLLLPATGIFYIWYFDFEITLVSFRANRRRRLPSFATRAESDGAAVSRLRLRV